MEAPRGRGGGGGGEQGAPCGRRPVPETLAPSEAEARAAVPSRALMGDRHEATAAEHPSASGVSLSVFLSVRLSVNLLSSFHYLPSIPFNYHLSTHRLSPVCHLSLSVIYLSAVRPHLSICSSPCQSTSRCISERVEGVGILCPETLQPTCRRTRIRYSFLIVLKVKSTCSARGRVSVSEFRRTPTLNPSGGVCLFIKNSHSQARSATEFGACGECLWERARPSPESPVAERL